MGKYNVEKIRKEIKKLGIPKEYFRIDLKSFFEHDYTILLSIRQDAGKTTQSLLLGLVLHKLYGDVIEYLRNDESQIRQRDIENLFNVIKQYHYIEKLYSGRWNHIEYFPRSKKFKLCKKEDDEIIEYENEPVCVVHSNENWQNMKSSYNSPKGDFIILDEFMDTKRATNYIWSEFMNNISTIGRPDAPGREPHVLMLGNNSNQYCFWFDDFCISDQIENLKFGGRIESNTKRGTTLCCYLLEQSEIQKKRIHEGKIRFFGFDTRKASQFIGLSEWSGNDYKHLDFKLDYDELITRRIYIKHRNVYMQIELFYNEEIGRFCFVHRSGEPKYDDNIVLTLNPSGKNEFYGIAEFRNKIFKRIKPILALRKENLWFYESNYIGELINDYFQNIE